MSIIYVILMVVFGITALVSAVAVLMHSGYGSKGPKVATMGGSLVGAFLVSLLFSFVSIPAQSVGVVTEFGKPQGVLAQGPHMKSPVASVEKFSTRVQPLELTGADNDIPVTYKGGGGGTVEAVVRWRTTKDNVVALWQGYRSFDNVRDQLVKSSAADSFRVILASYTPTDARAGENLREISEATKADLQSTLQRNGIIVDSVSVKNITLDKQAQASLDRVVSSSANVETARKEQERARIDAETNRLRQASLTPQALERYCLDVVNNWDAHKNGNLPAGFNCNGQSSVVVSGK